MKEVTINPVTRIEGHADVRIYLNDRGEVDSAHFQVVELRGFEKFLSGAAIEEAPRITPRICGICPTSHHLAAAKATDQIFGLNPRHSKETPRTPQPRAVHPLALPPLLYARGPRLHPGSRLPSGDA